MSPRNKEVIAVDLDGTLARYDGWVDAEDIGEPIMPMLDRVLLWLAEGKTVVIFTARVSHPLDGLRAKRAIERWCEEHIGQVLVVTCVKSLYMTEFWDDRAITVEKNTGRVIRASVEEVESEEPTP